MKKLAEGSTFILEVLEDGKVLYADEGFLNSVMGEYSRVRPRYKRAGKTWIRLGEDSPSRPS